MLPNNQTSLFEKMIILNQVSCVINKIYEVTLKNYPDETEVVFNESEIHWLLYPIECSLMEWNV